MPDAFGPRKPGQSAAAADPSASIKASRIHGPQERVLTFDNGCSLNIEESLCQAIWKSRFSLELPARRHARAGADLPLCAELRKSAPTITSYGTIIEGIAVKRDSARLPALAMCHESVLKPRTN